MMAAAAAGRADDRGPAVTYPDPGGGLTSTARFARVTVDGRPSPVYDLFDQRTYNKAVTAEPHFTSFTASDTAVVTVTTAFDFRQYKIRPTSDGITATRSGRTLAFAMPATARQLSVEFDGDAKRPLLVFRNPPDPAAPDPPPKGRVDHVNKVMYYGPGVHDFDIGVLLTLGDYAGWTLYVAGGAVVKLAAAGPNATLTVAAPNFAIRGPGVVLADGGKGTPLKPQADGFTLQHTVLVNRRDDWAVQVVGCEGARFDDFKLLSEIRDGWNAINSRDAVLANSFVMAHDDAIALKGLWYGKGKPVAGVRVENCVVANMGGGNGLEVGYELDAPAVRDVVFRDIDLIHCLPNGDAPDPAWPEGAMTVHVDGRAAVGGLRYEDIRVEDNRDDYLFDFSFKGFGTPADIDGIVVDNVRVVDGPWPPSRVAGKGPTARVKNVSFGRLFHGPDQVTDVAKGRFAVNSFTDNVTFGGRAVAGK